MTSVNAKIELLTSTSELIDVKDVVKSKKWPTVQELILPYQLSRPWSGVAKN